MCVSNSSKTIVVGEETQILSYKYMSTIFFPGRTNGGALDGEAPMSHVDFKERVCHI